MESSSSSDSVSAIVTYVSGRSGPLTYCLFEIIGLLANSSAAAPSKIVPKTAGTFLRAALFAALSVLQNLPGSRLQIVEDHKEA